VSIAILGVTGKEGRGLASRWARAGRTVLIGSRSEERGAAAAQALGNAIGASARLEGMSNADAARKADIVVSTLPYEGHIETLTRMGDRLAGKLLITATIAWPPSPTGRRSAAEEVAEAVPEAQVVAAFQTVSAGVLQEETTAHEEDVLIFFEDLEAGEAARELVNETGLRGVLAGPLEYARVAESLTGLLLRVNKRYRVKSTGIHITGLPT
jgi:NADPH-dependent F420 reductase